MASVSIPPPPLEMEPLEMDGDDGWMVHPEDWQGLRAERRRRQRAAQERRRRQLAAQKRWRRQRTEEEERRLMQATPPTPPSSPPPRVTPPPSRQKTCSPKQGKLRTMKLHSRRDEKVAAAAKPQSKSLPRSWWPWRTDADGSAPHAGECGICFEAFSLNDDDRRRAVFFPCVHAKQCLNCAMSHVEAQSASSGDVKCPWCNAQLCMPHVVVNVPPGAIWM